MGLFLSIDTSETLAPAGGFRIEVRKIKNTAGRNEQTDGC
ncbi:Uncharacterised protein [Chryseobacterium nakagawai]|nr:Uncharacterised protein [Chryseobacterium nakagawai]